MANLVEPFLESDERSMMSLTAKRGPNPWIPIGVGLIAGLGAYLAASTLPFEFFGMRIWAALAVGVAVLTALNLFLYKHRIIAVTNQSILSLHADTLNGTPTSVLTRLPRDTAIGPAKGIHASTTIDDERLWVPMRWRALLDVSDRGRNTDGDRRERSGSAADRRQPAGDEAATDATIDLRRPGHANSPKSTPAVEAHSTDTDAPEA